MIIPKKILFSPLCRNILEDTTKKEVPLLLITFSCQIGLKLSDLKQHDADG